MYESAFRGKPIGVVKDSKGVGFLVHIKPFATKSIKCYLHSDLLLLLLFFVSLYLQINNSDPCLCKW